MGLKETMKQTSLEIVPKSNLEDLTIIAELTEKLAQSEQMILTMQSENSTLQSKIQEMKSTLTIATEQIESLTSRATIVSKTELENQRLLKETQKALILSDKANQEAEQSKKQAKSETERAERSRQQAKKDEDERRKAETRVHKAERILERSVTTYKTLFIGNGIFTLVLAFFVAYGKRDVLTDMSRWFLSRWENVKWILTWLKGLYMGTAKMMYEGWGWSAIWGYLLASVFTIALFIGLSFAYRELSKVIGHFMWQIQSEYSDRFFKGVVSVNIILAMLYICLFFADPIRKTIPINIFSVWLILSFIGYVLWHIPEIIAIIEKY